MMVDTKVPTIILSILLSRIDQNFRFGVVCLTVNPISKIGPTAKAKLNRRWNTFFQIYDLRIPTCKVVIALLAT